MAAAAPANIQLNVSERLPLMVRTFPSLFTSISMEQLKATEPRVNSHDLIVGRYYLSLTREGVSIIYIVANDDTDITFITVYERDGDDGHWRSVLDTAEVSRRRQTISHHSTHLMRRWRYFYDLATGLYNARGHVQLDPAAVLPPHNAALPAPAVAPVAPAPARGFLGRLFGRGGRRRTRRRSSRRNKRKE